MPLSTGQLINNRYRIVKLLSQGSFGAIYRAWDTKQNSPCTVKENLDNSPAAQRQFALDADRLFGLQHPNLAQVFDAFSVPGQGQYLVMDFVEGDDLGQMLAKNGGPFEESQVLPWLLQVCDALSYLHNQTPPVFHRDLKPTNIRITSQGQAMVVDFGTAKVYDPNLRGALDSGAITPGFSAPEQYGVEINDVRSDIYALGSTAYALLTGKEPPPSMGILLGNVPAPPPVHVVNPQVSPYLSAAIQQAMALDVEKRFSSVAEFKQALQTPASHPGKIAPDAQKKPPIPGGIWIAAAGLLVIVVLAVLLLVVLNRETVGTSEEVTSSPTQVAVQITTMVPGPSPTAEATQTPLPSDTPLPTVAPSPTETEAVLETSPTIPAATDTAEPASEEIILQDWVLTEFDEITTGCPLPGGPCWSGESSRAAGDSTPLLLKLTSADFILIKKEWENPTLVFWHNYVTRTDSYVVTSILLGSAEIFLKQYTGSNGAGCYDAMDLSNYKDRLVKVYFYVKALTSSLDKPFSAKWLIQDVRIFPEFEQEMLPGVQWCK